MRTAGNRATGTPGLRRIGRARGGHRSRPPDTWSTASRSRSAISRAPTSSPSAPAPETGSSSSALMSTRCLAGAGLNDNASGVAALLVVAEALTHLAPPDATIRFAFWGAEEGGPFGSAAYVAALDRDDIAEIGGYLNFDMLGSPNGLTLRLRRTGRGTGLRGADRPRLQPVPAPRPSLGADRPHRPRRPRALHRCGHPHRRPLQRRPRAGDRCAGRPPRRHRRPAGRSVQPRRLRHDRQCRPRSPRAHDRSRSPPSSAALSAAGGLSAPRQMGRTPVERIGRRHSGSSR